MLKEKGEGERLLRRAFALSALLGHSYVGTEHLLLSVSMEQGSVGRQVLLRQALSDRELLGQLLCLRGQGKPVERLPYGLTVRARQAYSHASRGKVGLLESLLRQEHSGAKRLLRLCAVDTDLLFTHLYQGEEAGKEFKMQNTRLLEQFAVDLVERAATADPVIGRQREIETVLQILSRRQKNNPALIGEPGVGKTAIVEGVAQYIAAGRVPEGLRGKRLFSLDMASVIAGTKYRGEFEERIRDILAEIRRAKNVILFIDEMHTMVGAGAAEGAIDAANLLKPALGRGELQLIGATTLTEYRKFIEKDAALERRFRSVQVRPASKEETLRILEGLRPLLERHHGLPISEEAVNAAVEYACRYLPHQFLPDKAVDLLDEGAACANLSKQELGADEEGRRLEEKLHEAVEQGKYEQAAKLRDRLHSRKRAYTNRSVQPADIAAAVSNRTGIPVGKLSAGEKERLCALEEELRRQVIGQDAAVEAVCRAVRRGRSGIAEEGRPIAAILLTGPTGVGKTELCKALAQAVYGDREDMIRLDMSEYMEKHAISRLIGAPPGYVGHEEGGELTEKVRRKPYCLVLLDEVEKAHRDICGILLQIMEDGILTDSMGRKVDFKNTLLVMTSNLGSDSELKGALGFGQDQRQRATDRLRSHFSPELMGRIDCIAHFAPLGETELCQIAKLRLKEFCGRGERLGLRIELDPQLPSCLAKQAKEKGGGARAIRKLIQEGLESPLSVQLLSLQEKCSFYAGVKEGRIFLSCGSQAES